MRVSSSIRTSPVRNRNLTINDDCWIHILTYGDKTDLGRVASVSKSFHQFADNSTSWFYLCKFLWQDKQNHPLEQWVSLRSGSGSDRNSSSSNNRKERDEHFNLRRLENAIVEMESSKNIIIEEMTSVQNCLPPSGEDAVIDDAEQLKRFKVLQEYTERLEVRLVLFKRQKCLEDMHAYKVAHTSTETKLTREACPLSRAVRAEWIRSTEPLYFSLLDEMQVGLPQTLYDLIEKSHFVTLSRCRHFRSSWTHCTRRRRSKMRATTMSLMLTMRVS